MNTRAWWGIISILFIIIVVLTWVLFGTPAPVEAPTVSTSSPQATSDPLSKSVTVTSPKANAAVEKKFIVAGSAPGTWFFEASFPVQVRDKDNNKIGQGVAQAQGDWMTTDLVTFTTTITLSGNYTGPATLVLLRDNPSGLPENDDSVSIPITIQ
ncbi:MAG: Gmad2 immunoglobulin-like domain-containing protein [bacterium]|nr:Gmad2 immunoglobulin-like domain-containing protein [bacterium]